MINGALRCLLAGTLLLGFPLAVAAQITVPSNPNQFTKRKLGESGGSSVGISGASTAVPKTVVVEYVAVTPVESWSNVDGKTMEACLLAYSAPEEGESGPVEIIREGKVRFLVTGRKEPIDYPLEQLGEAERTKIQALAEMAAKGPPARE